MRRLESILNTFVDLEGIRGRTGEENESACTPVLLAHRRASNRTYNTAEQFLHISCRPHVELNI